MILVLNDEVRQEDRMV